MFNAAVGLCQETRGVGGVKPDFLDAFQRNPVKFERGIPPFEPFLRGENAVCGRAVVPNVDCVVQADLVAGLPAPVEENLAEVQRQDVGHLVVVERQPADIAAGDNRCQLVKISDFSVCSAHDAPVPPSFCFSRATASISLMRFS